MNRTAVATILRRDLTVVARSRAVSLPILLLPIVFFVLVPALLTLGAGAIGSDLAEFEELIALMPEALRRDLAGLDPSAQVIVWGLEYVFATFFLIVPLMTSAVIAADSFAGEKERKTLEALVYTPTSDLELYAGKLLAPWLAAVAVSTIGYVVFVTVASLVGGAGADPALAPLRAGPRPGRCRARGRRAGPGFRASPWLPGGLPAGRARCATPCRAAPRAAHGCPLPGRAGRRRDRGDRVARRRRHAGPWLPVIPPRAPARPGVIGEDARLLPGLDEAPRTASVA